MYFNRNGKTVFSFFFPIPKKLDLEFKGIPYNILPFNFLWFLNAPLINYYLKSILNLQVNYCIFELYYVMIDHLNDKRFNVLIYVMIR